MPNLILPKRYTTNKPPLGSVIDYSSPLSQGLVACFLMNEGAGNVVNNVASNRKGVLVGPWNTTKFGVGIGFNYVSGRGIQVPHDPRFNLTTNFSIVMFGTGAFAVIGEEYAICNKGAGSYELDLINSSGSVLLRFNRDKQAVILSYTIPPGTDTSSKLSQFAVTVKPGLNALYLQGKQVASNGSNPGLSNTTGVLGIGGDPATSAKVWQKNINIFFLYNRALSPSEIQSLYIAPYQMIAPRRQRFIIDMAGGEPEPPPSTVTPYGYLSCNKGWW